MKQRELCTFPVFTIGTVLSTPEAFALSTTTFISKNYCQGNNHKYAQGFRPQQADGANVEGQRNH